MQKKENLSWHFLKNVGKYGKTHSDWANCFAQNQKISVALTIWHRRTFLQLCKRSQHLPASDSEHQ